MAANGKNVLIVDDEEVIRTICYRSLDKIGFHVETAENGVKALERMRDKTYEIVFTDFKMPIMDGLELLEHIKRDFPFSEVIIMTAYATVESAINAMKTGAYDFILKPIKPDQIRIVATKCYEKIQLNEENKALRIANQKLIDLQKMKNKFIALTSHELRTPVSHLKGYLGILNDEYYDELPEEEKEQCMKVIFNAVDELEEIVVSMHNLIHLENGSTPLKVEFIDMNELIIEVVDSYKPIIKKRKQTIQFDKYFRELFVSADRKQIKGIVRELIQNAIKYTQDGGHVYVTTKQEGKFCVLSVKDDGIGIEKNEQGKIFEKFYEVQNSNYHSSGKNKYLGGGMGLGLPSVRAIAEAHEGGVKVNSEKGQGAEFLVYLPLAKKLN